MAKERFDSDTAAVLEAMLAAGRAYEIQLREERGANLSIDEVRSQLRRIALARAKRAAEQAAPTHDNAQQAARQMEANGHATEATQNGAANSTVRADPQEGDTTWAAQGEASSLHGAHRMMEDGLSEKEQHLLAELSERVPQMIDTLSGDPLEFVSYVAEGPSGSLYCVNMVRFLGNIRLKQLEAAARERYGQGGLRIFRMLTLRGQLEQKQVADFAMLPPKDTRELLYRMLKQGFVFMQDIPKTADRAPSRTFYTWRVDWPVTAELLGSQLYQAAGNVLMRAQYELDQYKELLDLVEAAQESGNSNLNLTAAQVEQLQRLQVRLRRLEVCLMHLDEQIALFNHY